MASRSLRLAGRLTRTISQRDVTSYTSTKSLVQQYQLCDKLRTANGALRISHQQRRWHTAPAAKNKQYEFEDIKNVSQNPSGDRILIDVREPNEYSAGYIPNALNVPVKSAPDAWFLPPDEFEDRFGFPKPDPAKEVVFYCRAGVRSSAAASIAEQSGYTKIGEYRGSWLDWEKKGGEKSG